MPNMSYVSPFDVRQVMQQDDFEIFHRFDTAPGFITPHSHDFYEIYFPRTTGVDYIVEGVRYHLGPGTLVMIPPGDIHTSEVDVPGLVVERFVLWLNTSFVNSLSGMLPRFRNLQSEGLRGRHMMTPDPETYDLMLGMLFSLLHEKRLNDMDSASLNRLVVTQLLIHITRILAGAQNDGRDREGHRYKDILEVVDYITQHIKDPLSVTDLAERFYFDKNTLTRRFKQVTGMTPGECIRRRRLEVAYTMITHGADTTEACRESGFTDYSTFYRAFKQVYGIIPSACAVRTDGEVKLMDAEKRGMG